LNLEDLTATKSTTVKRQTSINALKPTEKTGLTGMSCQPTPWVCTRGFPIVSAVFRRSPGSLPNCGERRSISIHVMGTTAFVRTDRCNSTSKRALGGWRQLSQAPLVRRGDYSSMWLLTSAVAINQKPTALTSDRCRLIHYGCLDERIISTDALVDDVPSG
jgi:hypothetical protein